MPDGSLALRPLFGLADLQASPAASVILGPSKALRERAKIALPAIVHVAAGPGFDLGPLQGRKVVALTPELGRAAAAAGATVRLLAGDLDDALQRGIADASWIRAHLAEVQASPSPARAPERLPKAPEPLWDAEPPRDASGPVNAELDLSAVPPWASEDALALTFTKRHGHGLRFVSVWNRWLRWDGAAWVFDTTLAVFDLARVICREAASECLQSGKERPAVALASAKTVAAVERLAKADPRHAATVEQWDADPWLLNTPAGAVDLRTGQLRPSAPGDYVTKRTAVAPAGDAPTWRRFLEEVTQGDMELVAFLRRMAGYALTGSVREHALFFLFGPGGNGKGTFLNTLTAVLGDYAAVASIETFTATPTDRHPTDLAMLRGARLVASQETEEGRHWAESRLKALTGGDPVTARFMRQDFFTFLPQFKLVIAGNHKPALRNVDAAMRRRLHLVPFTRRLGDEERDPTLPDTLRAEWPGILAWCIQGCVEWQRVGLLPPASVREASDDYFETEDALGAWMAECCDTAPGTSRFETSEALFTSWSEWAERAGEYVGSRRRFSQNLQARGFTPGRQPGTGRKGYHGINLGKPRLSVVV